MFRHHFTRKLLLESSDQHLLRNILYSQAEIQIKKSIIWWSIWMNQSHLIVNSKFLIFRKIFEKVILTVAPFFGDSAKKCSIFYELWKMSNDTPDEYYDFVNTAYWRTCSLLLEETVREGFRTASIAFSIITVCAYLKYSLIVPQRHSLIRVRFFNWLKCNQ